jgi:threonine/homoserine/homoserine lactone efflux protein
MFNFSDLSVFFSASLVLLLTPGPSVLYIVTRSLSQGRAAGLASVLGVQSGALVHVVGAALGVSAIIASSAMLFMVVKFIGAAYLIYLGLRRVLFSSSVAAPIALSSVSAREIFRQGFWVAALNPKTALFFLAFLPQFVTPSQGSVGLQLGFLGLFYIAMSCVVDMAYALLASKLRPWLLSHPSIWQREKYVSGSVYIVLGLLTAFSDTAQKSKSAA